MAILIDPPMWPGHGTLWSHLVSDESYEELHTFARRVPIPRRGFDLDHYDVPAGLYDRVISLGALPVGPRDVVHRLRKSQLRVRQADREMVQPARRREFLVTEWGRLAELAGVSESGTTFDRWHHLGAELIERWNEAHRTYHDERHLEDVLLSLDQLATRGERVASSTLLAAWFHDAVYQGVTGEDEEASAQIAARTLAELGLPDALVLEVRDLIVATTPTFVHTSVSEPLAHLLDADLSIFASSDARYEKYALAVRSEYAHVPEPLFREGRAGILRGYIDQPTIYRTEAALTLWERRARENLAREIAALTEPSAHNAN
ncbi:MAG: DUF4031 domain-containing protein [Leucobacter sp.]